MGLHDLKKAHGSTKKTRRIGRGAGSGKGEQSGRGHKGSKARSGTKRKFWYEGGQMPLVRRIPKRGFVNPNKVYYQLVKLEDITRKCPEASVINPETLKQAGLIKSMDKPIKIMGTGTLSAGVAIYAQAFTRSAAEKIQTAGGKVERI